MGPIGALNGNTSNPGRGHNQDSKSLGISTREPWAGGSQAIESFSGVKSGINRGYRKQRRPGCACGYESRNSPESGYSINRLTTGISCIVSEQNISADSYRRSEKRPAQGRRFNRGPGQAVCCFEYGAVDQHRHHRNRTAGMKIERKGLVDTSVLRLTLLYI